MNRPYRCVCSAAAADVGELEEHILTGGEGDHRPADASHTTDRVTAHVAAAARRREVLGRLADAAGVTVVELREALR